MSMELTRWSSKLTYPPQYKDQVQGRWMDWVTNGSKYDVEYAFGTFIPALTRALVLPDDFLSEARSGGR